LTLVELAGIIETCNEQLIALSDVSIDWQEGREICDADYR